MENRTLKIFISCALGAGIGSLIAFQANHYFWWLGMLAGGFVGYASYEFNNVIAAVPLAWRYATANRPRWKDKKQTLRKIIVSIPYVLLLSGSWGFLLIAYFIISDKIAAAFDPIGVFLALIVIISLLASFAYTSEADAEGVRKISITLNAFSVICYYLPKGVWFFGKTVVVDMLTLFFAAGHLFKHLFILIHSDARLLCGVDAAIGVVIGYFYGSAIIGAISGGVFGVINYELISKRVLGVVPRR